MSLERGILHSPEGERGIKHSLEGGWLMHRLVIQIEASTKTRNRTFHVTYVTLMHVATYCVGCDVDRAVHVIHASVQRRHID